MPHTIQTLVVGVFAITLSQSVTPAQEQSQPLSLTPTAGRIAIFPFENINNTPDDDWIGQGIAETLGAHIQEAAQVDIFTPSRVLEFIGAESAAGTREPGMTDAIALASTTGAQYLITGAYQRLRDQLRITARIVDVTNRSVRHTATVDGLVANLFVLQDELADLLTTSTDREVSAARTVTGQPASESTNQDGQRDGRASTTTLVSNRPATIIDGPPAPIEPEVISRDAQRNATIRAVKLDGEIRVDGSLDEPFYQTTNPITGFIQQAPLEGADATEQTEAWILFDETNLYVSGRVSDSASEDEWVANEMRRDTRTLRQNDTFAVILDTFYDRRNAVAFYTNPLGAIADFAITNEGNPNSDWNPVWNVQVGRFDGGWTVEMEIPFKSLRYRPGPNQIWGVQLRRAIRRKNEWAYITPLPISAGGGPAGIFRVSDAATLVGLEVPSGSKNIEIKPYAIAGINGVVDTNGQMPNTATGNAGLDFKYGVTQNLTADFTYNTDFAQVEVDEQQVNLTRFSLFFPEKREFFLEGRGIFDFARGGITGGFGGALRRGGQGGGFFGGGNAPTIFYSRRIGLQSGTVVPIIGGGRVTGKVGSFDVGALNIQTDDEVISGATMTNFSVVRMKRDILRRSSVGMILTNRSVSSVGNGSNQAFGADATFSFYENVSLLGYIAKTATPGITGEDESYQGRFNYGGDRYGFQAEHLLVGDNFIPDVGFVRRDNFRRTYTTARFSPRPDSIASIRQFSLESSFDFIQTADTGIVETRQSQLGFSTQFENSDRVGISVADNYEFLSRTFSPGPGVSFPIGGYSFQDVEATYSPGAQRRVNGTLTIRAGEYFDGDIRSVGFRQGRIELTSQFSLEPSVSINWVDTPHGSFRTDLAVSRVNYTFTPRMFFSGLVQYNSSNNTVSSNLRLRWEYSPGSELFVVYTEARDTDPLRPDRIAELRNRGFVVKLNRLLRY